MTADKQPTRVTIDDWPFRIKKPTRKTASPELILLLHGHLGDENVMWILAKPLPGHFWMLSPRAPVEIEPGHFSWHRIESQWPTLKQYGELTHALLDRVDLWCQQNDLAFDHLNVMGFSQGAVMAYALAILHPDRVQKIAALAGFLPARWKSSLNEADLRHQNFFIAHGTEDEIIPVTKAEQAVAWLRENQARTTFCEAETGHKLSAKCFPGLGDFFKRTNDH